MEVTLLAAMMSRSIRTSSEAAVWGLPAAVQNEGKGGGMCDRQ